MSEVKERPILFSPPMVEALNKGLKTVTRRPIKPQPTGWDDPWPTPDSHVTLNDISQIPSHYQFFCPYGQVGDKLWIKETWKVIGWEEDCSKVAVAYKDTKWLWHDLPYVNSADGDEKWVDWLTNYVASLRVRKGIALHPTTGVLTWENDDVIPWRASLFMPRWASRTTLEIKELDPELLQDITEHDARREGVEPSPHEVEPDTVWPARLSYRTAYRRLWDSLQSNLDAYGWDANPFVWRIAF